MKKGKGKNRKVKGNRIFLRVDLYGLVGDTVGGPNEKNPKIDWKKIRAELKKAGYAIYIPYREVLKGRGPCSLLLGLSAEKSNEPYCKIKGEVEKILGGARISGRTKELYIIPADARKRKEIEKSSGQTGIDLGCDSC